MCAKPDKILCSTLNRATSAHRDTQECSFLKTILDPDRGQSWSVKLLLNFKLPYKDSHYSRLQKSPEMVWSHASIKQEPFRSQNLTFFNRKIKSILIFHATKRYIIIFNASGVSAYSIHVFFR